MDTNLNTICRLDEHDKPVIAQRDNSTVSGTGVKVFFKDLTSNLIQLIDQADLVVGCVAWMTNFNILQALASKNTSILIQKEDWLRPDTGDYTKRRLRDMYDNLQCNLHRWEMPDPISNLNVASSDSGIDPVRSVGIVNTTQAAATPRMHHKFVVFCKVLTTPGEDKRKVIPYAVWTGSFNFTHNGENSLENGVYITDPCIVDAYMAEYCQIFALSEPLDWNSAWVEPQYRDGT